jgi:TPR repeat protein
MQRKIYHLNTGKLLNLGNNVPAKRMFEDSLRWFKTGEHEKALVFLQRLAEQGLAEAQYVLGMLYEYGLQNGFCSGGRSDVDEEKDLETAAGWYWKAADCGHEQALLRIRHIDRHAPWDASAERKARYYANQKAADKKLLQLCQKAATQGDIERQFDLACQYLRMSDFYFDDAHLGKCIEPDSYLKGREKLRYELRAVRLLFSLAHKDHTQSQLFLGYLYLIYSDNPPYFDVKKWTDEDIQNGLAKGVQTKWKHARRQAAYWFEKATASENPHACYALAGMYDRKGGANQRDIQKSVLWYRKAVDYSEPESDCATTAMGHLHSIYRRQAQNVRKEDTDWLRGRAEGKDQFAQLTLSHLYTEGKGVERDETQAAFWLRRFLDQPTPPCPPDSWCGHYIRTIPYCPTYEYIGRAAYEMGCRYISGRGVDRDDAEAARCFLRAAEDNHAAAQYALAYMYHHGKGVECNDDEALERLYKANSRWRTRAFFFDHDSSRHEYKYAACSMLWKDAPEGYATYMYRDRPPDCFYKTVLADWTDYPGWLEIFALNGDKKACFNLGTLYLGGQGRRRDTAQALCWFKQAAGYGDAESCYVVNEFYKYGVSVEQDAAEALAWRKKAAEIDFIHNYDWHDMAFSSEVDGLIWLRTLAEKGNCGAKRVLATHSRFSEGVENPLALLTEAAEAGDIIAQRDLGLWYFEGEGVAQDYVQAAYWLGKAVSSIDMNPYLWNPYGDGPDPRSLLGLLLREGKGVERDPVRAARYFEQTQYAMGNINFVLGMAYECGNGVNIDMRSAKKYYQNDEVFSDWSSTGFAGYFLNRLELFIKR